ncbi:uncharacterized protein Dvir_GJ21331 [Drosophila virilis]|uniref:Uncharacterized protein n=1 Tax=Drosophila virilis TaxID=7244 RepID=B4LNT7_DROVI|nr:uncharacterized protein Dvir_GJ21331 [Drosophila virilis]
MIRLLVLILSLVLLMGTAHGNHQFWLKLFGLTPQNPSPAPITNCQGYPYPCTDPLWVGA